MKKNLFAATIVLLCYTSSFSQIGGLAHINIQSKDIQKAKIFYINTLQFKDVYNKDMPDAEGRMRKFTILQSGTCVLEIMQPADTSTVNTKMAGTIPHFAIEVTGIEKIIADLKSKKVTFKKELFERPDFLGGIKGVFIYGPEGEEIELLEYTGKRPY